MNLSMPLKTNEMHPVDSVAADRPRILVIQLGSELACMMTRGWIRALHATAEIEIVSQSDYREILDFLPDPARYHSLTTGPVSLLRLQKTLRAQKFDRVLCLNDNIASRWLASVCPIGDRIKSAVGPPSMPEEIDSVFAVLFGRLGITTPQRRHGLMLSSATKRAAATILQDFGYGPNQQPVMIAPRAGTETKLLLDWQKTNATNCLPVLLIPAGNEIEFINALAGQAYLVPTPDFPLRAALIGRAQKLISNDPDSQLLARLMHTSLTAD